MVEEQSEGNSSMNLRIEHHHYLHYDPPMLRKVLEEVLETKHLTQALGRQLMSAKDDLAAAIAQVNENTNEMAASLEEGQTETARIGTLLQSLIDQLASAKDGLTKEEAADMLTQLQSARDSQQTVEDKQRALVEALKATGADGTITPVNL